MFALLRDFGWIDKCDHVIKIPLVTESNLTINNRQQPSSERELVQSFQIAKLKHTFTLVEMERKLGYNIDFSNYTDEDVKRF